ncbi:MAG: hypothetical protein WC881_05805 [Elusimicrobiota bacterium]|jgi:hypothetical protein
MKMAIFLILVLAGGGLLYVWLSRQSTPDRIQQDPMVKYTNSLQSDVRKAQEAQAQANEAVRQMQGRQDTFREEESK